MAEKNGFEEHELALAGIKSQGGVAEQSLKGPAASQVNADAAGGLANASAEFEQVGSQGFDLRRAPGLRQMMSEEVDQVIGSELEMHSALLRRLGVTDISQFGRLYGIVPSHFQLCCCFLAETLTPSLTVR